MVWKHVCVLVVDYICILMSIRKLMYPCRGVCESVCPRICVFVNVSYPLPLIITRHIHVWHLPLTSAPRQAQLLKGQTPQRMSITSTLSSPPSIPTTSFFYPSPSVVVLIWSGKETVESLTQFDIVKRWSFIFSLLHFLSLSLSFFWHSFLRHFIYISLSSLMHFLCTLNQRLSKVSKSDEQVKEREIEQKNKGWKKDYRDRERREAWLGAVTGQLPVPLPAFLSPSFLPPPPLSIHLQVTELFSRGEGMKRLRENYTESFSLTRQGKWRVGTSNNFWKDRFRGQTERLDKRRTDRCRGRKRPKKLFGIRGHGRWREGDWERSELEKKQNLYVDPTQRGGYFGGRKELSLR